MTTKIIVAVAAIIIAGTASLSSTSQAATPYIRDAGNSDMTQRQTQDTKPVDGPSIPIRIGRISAKDRSADVRPDPAETLDTARPAPSADFAKNR